MAATAARERTDLRIPPLDIETLGDNTMRDVSLQKELFDLYFSQAPGYLDAMRDAISGGDRSSWIAAAHSLKGTARTLGLMRLAASSAAAEASEPSEARLLKVDDDYVSALAAAYAYLAGAS